MSGQFAGRIYKREKREKKKEGFVGKIKKREKKGGFVVLVVILVFSWGIKNENKEKRRFNLVLYYDVMMCDSLPSLILLQSTMKF